LQGYNVVDATPFGRDTFGELAAAMRAIDLYGTCVSTEFFALDGTVGSHTCLLGASIRVI
jgi:hypothetical protein